MCLLDGLLLLPVALWQTGGQYAPTGQDLIALLLIGVFTTALAFTMWVEGVARVRVQHSAILGLLSAVASAGVRVPAPRSGALGLDGRRRRAHPRGRRRRGAARRRRAGAGAAALTGRRQPVIARAQAGRDLTGYGLVAACFVLVGLSGALVAWADAPASVLLVLRLGIAAFALGLVFARRRAFRTFLRRDLWLRFLLMGVLDGGSLLAYFYAIRETGVAVATFLLFVQPVWVALLAPRLLRAPTERLVYLALGVALAGLGVIMAPGFTGGGVTFSAAGVAAGLAAGVLYAFFQLLVKDLTRQLPSTTIVTLECTLDMVVILPLALWQWTSLGVVLTRARPGSPPSSWGSCARPSPTPSGWRVSAGSRCSTAPSSGSSRRWSRRCSPGCC